jgi:hypothetical protein
MLLAQVYTYLFKADEHVVNFDIKAYNKTHAVFEVDIPFNSYFGIGFGSSMSNVDMTIF